MAKGRHRAYLTIALSVCLIFIIAFCPVVAGFYLPAIASESKDMVLHFINVGQGDATFIELPDGKTVLIDAGTSEFGESVVEYISSLGYTKLDCVIATHADSDHVGGLDDVLTAFEVHYIFRPFVIARNTNPIDDLTTLGLTENQITYDDNVEYKSFIEATYKETYNGGGAIVKTISNKSLCEVFMGTDSPYYAIEILYPYASDEYEAFTTYTGKTSGYIVENESLDSNEMSAVITIQTESNKILLMADADESIENSIVEKAGGNSTLMTKISNVDILKVAHHGSKYSTSTSFLEVAKPRHSIISVGEGNSYGHPNEETIERINAVGSNIYRTDKDGNIVIKINSLGEIVVNKEVDNGETPKLIPESVMYIIFVVIIMAIITIAIIYTAKKKNKSSVKVKN